jgi:hypothetical protein
MKARITKQLVDDLLPGQIVTDVEIRGFNVRRLGSGTVSYGYRYRIGGKQYWLALGQHGRITAHDARTLCKKAASKIAHARLGEALATIAASGEANAQ